MVRRIGREILVVDLGTVPTMDLTTEEDIEGVVPISDGVSFCMPDLRK